MGLHNLSQIFESNLRNCFDQQTSLGEEFILCENGGMIFHWADYHETCDFIKAQIEENSDLKNDLSKRESSLKRLERIPVWIKTETKIFQLTIFELYERYLLHQTSFSNSFDPFSPLEISFISGTGPFKTMPISDCFNSSTYRDFIMVYLLQGKLPRRDYRIRLKSKVVLEYGKGYSDAELISLEQLTSRGFLFSMDSEVFFKSISKKGEEVRLLINSEMLMEGLEKNLGELKTHLSQFAFSLLYSSRKEDAVYCHLKDFSLQSSFDFSSNKKLFLFIRYECFGDAQKMVAIKAFVDHTKALVKSYYRTNTETQRNIA